ncbi:MAG: CynX/NimT family MFS transporter [Akkermansia muciniphila]
MDKAGTSGGIRGKMLLFAAFLIVCFNLRTGFDSPDPLLGTIERDMGLSLENSGLFALLPVFVLGVAAPISPRVARRMTPWKIIFWFQLLAVAGIFWRSWDGVAGLYGGMVLMGLGMGIAGAAIPGLIKHQFPDRASAMMGVYSAMIGVGAPWPRLVRTHLNMLGGWRFGLGCGLFHSAGNAGMGAPTSSSIGRHAPERSASSGLTCCAAARHGRSPSFIWARGAACFFIPGFRFSCDSAA